MSCSFICICTRSLRCGSAVMRPVKPSRSTSIQFGAGAWAVASRAARMVGFFLLASRTETRSEEHTSELQSLRHLVCRLLLEKKKDCRVRAPIVDGPRRGDPVGCVVAPH